ncbi:MAG: HD domain-containing protein [Oligoflexia bacterium]|nr:HD domain-containing protein [Oligoflexia bacterium]
MPTSLHSPLVIRALHDMERDFAGKLRKTPPGWQGEIIPFFRHLEEVGASLARRGYDPEVVAAGVLHDAIEDLPKLWSRDRIVREYSPRIAELVDWVTQQDKKISWEERNVLYNNRIAGAPTEAIAISMADKESNIAGLLGYLKNGYGVAQILKRGWATNSDKFHELKKIYEERLPARDVLEFEMALQQLDILGPRCEVPKVGETIYIPTTLHMSHGADDCMGGRATIIEVSANIITVQQLPHLKFNWHESLAEQQSELRARFGDEVARPLSEHRSELH